MWPEYYHKTPNQKEVVGLEGNKIFDSSGSITPVRGYEDVRNFLETNSCMLFTDSFSDQNFILACATDTRNKVICDKHGKVILIRASGLCRNRRGNAWIVRSGAWGSTLTPDFLNSVSGFFKYCGVGSCPTPGSLGHSMMKSMQYGKRHTSLNIACEKYIREHRIGGIVQTPGIGKEYQEALELDMCSAYLSTFTELPTGTPIRITGREAYNFKTFFVQCTVIIKRDLALGPFPIRKTKRGKVQWPVLEGRYENVYLWKFQVEDCIRAGCDVALQGGWAWERITTDTLQWARKAYELRTNAQSDEHAIWAKASAVSAIGHHAMGRESYEIVTENKIDGTSRPFLDSYGDCHNLWINESYNGSSAIMVHWNNYCISMCNSVVYNFAKPFAEEGRLLAIDYDAILITEKDETHSFICKKSIDALQQPPGTWMWTKMHQVRIDAHRAYVALEHSKQPGLQKHHALDKRLQMMYT